MYGSRILALALVAAFAANGVGAASAGDGALPAPLQEVRAAAARYHSIEQAERAGYSVAGEPCIASPAGTMGVHAVNAGLLADDTVDSLRPEILLYVPKANGKLELVAVEYWKADADQNLATTDDRPSLFGQVFNGPMPGHSPVMPAHYDLHARVAEANPNGVFALFNPALACS